MFHLIIRILFSSIVHFISFTFIFKVLPRILGFIFCIIFFSEISFCESTEADCPAEYNVAWGLGFFLGGLGFLGAGALFYFYKRFNHQGEASSMQKKLENPAQDSSSNIKDSFPEGLFRKDYIEPLPIGSENPPEIILEKVDAMAAARENMEVYGSTFDSYVRDATFINMNPESPSTSSVYYLIMEKPENTEKIYTLLNSYQDSVFQYIAAMKDLLETVSTTVSPSGTFSTGVFLASILPEAGLLSQAYAFHSCDLPSLYESLQFTTNHIISDAPQGPVEHHFFLSVNELHSFRENSPRLSTRLTSLSKAYLEDYYNAHYNWRYNLFTPRSTLSLNEESKWLSSATFSGHNWNYILELPQFKDYAEARLAHPGMKEALEAKWPK